MEEGCPGTVKVSDTLNPLPYFDTQVFTRDEATLYERVSFRRMVGWSDGPTVTNHFFGLLGATRALFDSSLYEGVSIRLLDGRLGRFSYTNCLRFCH